MSHNGQRPRSEQAGSIEWRKSVRLSQLHSDALRARAISESSNAS